MSVSDIKPIFFFKTPDLSEYYSVITGFTKFHERNYIHMVASCRNIIELEPCILACPSGNGHWANCVQIIVHKEYKDTRGFKSNLKKNQLEFLSNGVAVDNVTYQRALKNTILTKLSPKWSTVGNYLVEGEDFLTKYGALEAISSLELVANTDKTHITFEGILLNWPQIPKMPFGLYSHQNITTYTLPTLKPSHVHSVTPVLPQWGPIETYEDMKIFWKNTYGYKLPSNPGCDIAFVTVNFGHNPSQYNYPKYCCLPHPPTVIARVDPFPIIGKFVRDFHNRVGSILGQPLQFLNNKAVFPTNKIETLATLTGSGQDSKNFDDNVGLTDTVPSQSYPFKNMANYKQETVKTELDELPDLIQSPEDVEIQEEIKQSTKRYITVFNAKKIKPQMMKKENNKVTITGKLSPESLDRVCNVEITTTGGSSASAAASVNVEYYAENNMLNKLNIAQLKDFLKRNHIPFKSTDKKNALVESVQKYLQK